MCFHVAAVGREQVVLEEGVLEVPGEAFYQVFGVGCAEECLDDVFSNTYTSVHCTLPLRSLYYYNPSK